MKQEHYAYLGLKDVKRILSFLTSTVLDGIYIVTMSVK